MQHRRTVSLLSLYLVLSVVVSAQPTKAREEQNGYIFQHLDYTDGLLSNEVFSFAQDRKGYMWIGTREGLQRYDGLRFVNYTDTTAGVDNFVTADIYPDDTGNRLLYNKYGDFMQEWELLTHRRSMLDPAAELKKGAGRVYRDVTGREWRLRIYMPRYRQKDGVAILQEQDKAPVFVAYARDAGRGQIWVSMSGRHGALVFDETNGQVQTPEDAGDNALLQLLAKKVTMERNLFLDSHDNVWLITWSSYIFRWNMRENKVHTYTLADVLKQQARGARKEGWVAAMLEDDHQRLWIATAYAGLLEYHNDSDAFTYVLPQTNNGLSLQYNHEINSLFQDREENIWLGTDKGISIFNPYRQYFSPLSPQKHYPAPVPDNEINCVARTAGDELLIGSWGGGIRVYDHEQRPVRNISFGDDRDRNLIWCFGPNMDGTTWVGCQHGIIHLLDARSRHVKTIHPPELENSTVRCMEKDSAGRWFLGLHNGTIVIMDPRTGQFLRFNRPGQDSSFALSPVLNIFIDHEGRCWASTLAGLLEFDISRRCYSGKYKPYAGSPAICGGIAEYNDSLLAVGIQHAGLFLFNRVRKTFSKLTSGNEQPLSAYAVRKDSAGYIWFTTDYDLCRYSIADRKLQTYHPGKWLITSSFGGSRFVTLPSGKWLAWTTNETVLFDPSVIGATRVQPDLQRTMITGMKVFDRPLFIDSFLHMRKPVRLSYKENFITMEYSGLQFSGVSQPSYYYRLTGVDKEWVYAGSRGYANYTGLAPAKYQFQVKRAGSGDEDVATMEIEIVPPFWGAGWFRGLCLILLAGLLYALIRWRVSRIRREADLQQRMATTEMMALRAQMNPHFIFNCINGIDALIQSDDKYHATIYLNKFAKLIRNILDSSRQNSILLTKDLETLRLYIELEQFRNDIKFTAEIRIDIEVTREDYKVPPLIIQPYVENAILHGLRNLKDGEGRLFIGVSRLQGHLRYTIEDNGVGRAASKKDTRRKSYGMEMSRDRLKLYNGQTQAPVTVTDLEVDGRPAGTRVEVLLKIQ